MSLLWVPITLIAASAQTARNATQRSLTEQIGTLGATQVRFLFGLPFACLFLGLVMATTGEGLPAIPRASWLYTLAGALSQIAATALMLMAMKEKSFAVTTAYIKMEPVLTAFAGFLLIGDTLTPLKLAGIGVATLGVVLMSVRREALGTLLQEVRPALLGVAAGGLFGLSAVAFRGAIIGLPEGSFVLRASLILVLGLAMQTAILVAWLSAFDRAALIGGFRVWRQSLAAGFLGAFASQFWFLGFALTSAANVRTLALVEVFMAQAVSRKLFAEGTRPQEYAGMALIVLGVGLVMWAAG